MVHSNAELIARFYSALAASDPETMAASYSDAATFGDPVFPHLGAEEVRSMWKMFCTSGNEIAVTFSNVAADSASGSADWEARYVFPKTGRRVHNRVASSFRFENGLITEHRDRFDLYRWTRMALGPVGLLLGWTPVVQNQVRAQAASQLKRFQAAS